MNEQLACSTPNTSSAFIFPHKDTTYTMFQMLSSWRNPSPAHSVFTNPCVSDSTGPDVAMQYGLNSFNGTYFELWTHDLDWPQYNNFFQTWHDSLEMLCNQMTVTVSDIKIEENDITIYPNPTKGIFTVSCSYKIKKAEIYAFNGQLINSKTAINLNTFEIDIVNYPSGIYFVTLINDYMITTVKIIKE
jgi:hypothetical protein